MIGLNSINHGDCLDLMGEVEDHSIDMILCDLPYGTLPKKWDIPISLNELWKHYNRIIRPNGAIVLTAREPFTSQLVCSNPKNYKHKWVWNKKQAGNFMNAKYGPLQIEEDILVFSSGGKVRYFPQMWEGKMRKRGGAKETSRSAGDGFIVGFENFSNLYNPTNILEIANPRTNKLHPTQKPVALFEYLIKTYSKEGEVVLDTCAGSGTTGVSCISTNRRFILMEKEREFIDVMRERFHNIHGISIRSNYGLA